VWALLKRQVIGIHHFVSPKHLHRYVAEITWRFNRRDLDAADRMIQIFERIEGRLTYKALKAGPTRSGKQSCPFNLIWILGRRWRGSSRQSRRKSQIVSKDQSRKKLRANVPPGNPRLKAVSRSEVVSHRSSVDAA